MPVGPYVATLTGDDMVVVPASASNNINVVGDGVNITTTGNAGANKLTISLINNLDVAATTTDNTPTLAYTLATANNKGYAIFVKAVGSYATYANALAQAVSGVALNDAGTLTTVGSQGTAVTTGGFPANIGPSNPNRYGVSFTVSGTNVLINVTGVAATNMNWTLNIQYFVA
jgi:hypothetical protein